MSFHMNGWKIVLFGIATGALLMAALAFRAHQTTATDLRLCHVLVSIVRDGDKALDGIAYYRTHPGELRAAHQRNEHIIGQLRCSHLPSSGGTP